jgi:hypothetical protein
MEEVQAQAAKSHKKQGNRDRDCSSGEWDWKRKEPRDKDMKIKNFRGKTYHWCHHHKLWCLHKASNCTLNEDTKHKSRSITKKEKYKSSRKKEKHCMKVYQILMEDTSDEEDAEESHSEEESEGTSESE